MISYAQNFEDVLLNRLFGGKTNGFYIDVGAHDPEELSVTKHFYDLGWHGINIEPVPESHQRFVERRPRDTNLKIALGERLETRSLFVVGGKNAEVDDGAAFSSFDRGIAEGGADALGGSPLRELNVEMHTLAEVCDRHASCPIDFVKIDVEGWEAPVLRGANFERHRPIVMVVESIKPCGAISVRDPSSLAKYATWHEWEGILFAAQYEFAHFDGLNRFYVRREDSPLLEYFKLPPGLFDGFELADPRRYAKPIVDQLVETHPRLAEERARVDAAQREIDEGQRRAAEALERAASELAEERAHSAHLVDQARIELEQERLRGTALLEQERLRNEALLEQARRELEVQSRRVADLVERCQRLEQAQQEALSSAGDTLREADERQRQTDELRVKLLDEAQQREATLNRASRLLFESEERTKAERLRAARFGERLAQLDSVVANAAWLESENSRLGAMVSSLVAALRASHVDRVEASSLRAKLASAEGYSAGLRIEAQRLAEANRVHHQAVLEAEAAWNRVDAEARRAIAERDDLAATLACTRDAANEFEYRRAHRLRRLIDRLLPGRRRMPLAEARPSPGIKAADMTRPCPEVPASEAAPARLPSPRKSIAALAPAPAVVTANVGEVPDIATSAAALVRESPDTWTLPLRAAEQLDISSIEVFDPYPEYTLALSDSPRAIIRPWAGQCHLPLQVPAWYKRVPSQERFAAISRFDTPEWRASKAACVHLFASSQDHAARLRVLTGVPVSVARRPLPVDRPTWSWERYASDARRRMIQPTERLQRLHGLHMLDVPEQDKVWWRDVDLAPEDLESAEREELTRNSRLHSAMLGTVTMIPNPHGEDRAEELSRSLVFLHLYDASGPSAVLECLSGATPILINALPAVIEILGPRYPFYFHDYYEARAKAGNDELIRSTHRYLLELKSRHDLSGIDYKLELMAGILGARVA